MTNQDFEVLHQKAHAAGIEAAIKARPAPMHVTDGTKTYFDEGARKPGTFAFKRTEASPWEFSATPPAQYVELMALNANVNAGACGFAYITFAGTTAWARWAKNRTLCEFGRPDMKLAHKHYPTGYAISVHTPEQVPQELDRFGQSVDIKYAYARAYAATLEAAGIEAYADSRLD